MDVSIRSFFVNKDYYKSNNSSAIYSFGGGSGIVTGNYVSHSLFDQMFELTYDASGVGYIRAKLDLFGTRDITAYSDSSANVASIWDNIPWGNMPYATTTTIGGIKVGHNLQISSGFLSVKDACLGTGGGGVSDASVISIVNTNTSINAYNSARLGGEPSAFYARASHLHTGVYADSSHNHMASDITSGTLTVARGGTGQSSLTANKVLVGNGTSGILSPTELHWDNTNKRLGIGITDPAVSFHVSQANSAIGVTSTTGSNYTYQYFQNTGGYFQLGKENSSGGGLLTGSSAYASVINSYSNYPMQFGTNNTLKMTLTASGDLGLGITTPTKDGGANGRAIHIHNTGSYTSELRLTNAHSGSAATDGAILELGSTSNLYLYNLENAPLYLGTNNTSRLVILGSGEVGLGTTTPTDYHSSADDFVIYKASGDAGMTIATSTAGNGCIYFADGTSGAAEYMGAITYAHSTNEMGITANGSTMLYLNSSGIEYRNGLTTVGATMWFSTRETTVVANDVLGRINFQAPLESSGSDAILIGASIVALAEAEFTSSVNKTSLVFQTGSSETATTKMTLTSAGALQVVGEVNAYYPSDKSLKNDISPIKSALNTIDKLNPVCFKWNQKAKDLNSTKDDRNNFGLIAQELEEVLPELVHPIYDKYKSIDYVQLVPLLISALKEQQVQIKKQQSDIDELKYIVKRIEGKWGSH